MYVIDILDLQRKAFGLASNPIRWFKTSPNSILTEGTSVGAKFLAIELARSRFNIQPDGSNPYDIEVAEVTEAEVYSALGTPVILPVTVLAGRYQDGVKDGRPVFVEYPEYKLPFASIMEINLPKNIVKTKIAGRNGTVKEYIGDDDFQVRFKGLIVNDDLNNPPEQGIRDFMRIRNVPAAIEVQCELFEWLGISELVIEDGGIFQLEGFQHVVGFTLDCVSDNAIEVKLRDGL